MDACFPSLTEIKTNVPGQELQFTCSLRFPAFNSITLPSLLPASVGQHRNMYQYHGNGHYVVEDSGLAKTSGSSLSTTRTNYSGRAGIRRGVCGVGVINMGLTNSAPSIKGVIEAMFRMVEDLVTAGCVAE